MAISFPEKEHIERALKERRAEVLKQQEVREKELTKEKEKEILREVVSEHIRKARSPSAGQQKVVVKKAQQIKTQPKERQIQLLTELAFEKGISHAIEVAKRLDSPYLLDEFHDFLVDELYNKLIETGKLKAL